MVSVCFKQCYTDLDDGAGELQQSLKGHKESANYLTFSHNSGKLASAYSSHLGGRDRTLQQTLHISSIIRNLSFNVDDLHLITEIGTIALDQPPLRPLQTPCWLGYCLSANHSWITWNGNNVLWLLLEHRPRCSIIKEQTVVIGCFFRPSSHN